MNRNIKPDDPEFVFAYIMRSACPTTGTDWHKFMAVELEPGGVIKPHKHAHHTVLYYPEEAEPVIVTPQPGTLLYLPPGTLHQVPRVQRRRVSYAMLMDKEKS